MISDNTVSKIHSYDTHCIDTYTLDGFKGFIKYEWTVKQPKIPTNGWYAVGPTDLPLSVKWPTFQELYDYMVSVNLIDTEV